MFLNELTDFLNYLHTLRSSSYCLLLWLSILCAYGGGNGLTDFCF